jgi:pilus assembly protein CpaE
MALATSYPVIIIDSDPDSSNKMSKYIENLGDHAEVAGVAISFEEGFKLIHKTRPSVVIMEVCEDVELSLERMKTILNRFPQVSIFATCADKSADTILKIMKAGADEYLLRPVSEADLDSALQKHGRLWLTKPVPEEEVGSVFSVFSPKGGVGTTTIAINLATNVYESTKKPTIIVDLDLNAGDATTFLNLSPSYTISDVTLNMSRLDKSFLKGVLTRHRSGIYILAEPQKVREGVSITGGDVKKVLNLLKTMFNYIVIDTETAMDERTMAAIEMSDLIMLVFVMSLPGIKNMQRYLSYFEEMGFGREKVKLMVNRYLKKGDIRLEDAEKALSYPIFWSIPNDYDASMGCLNKGLPLSMCVPRSHVNVSIKDLTNTLLNLEDKGT